MSFKTHGHHIWLIPVSQYFEFLFSLFFLPYLRPSNSTWYHASTIFHDLPRHYSLPSSQKTRTIISHLSSRPINNHSNGNLCWLWLTPAEISLIYTGLISINLNFFGPLTLLFEASKFNFEKSDLVVLGCLPRNSAKLMIVPAVLLSFQQFFLTSIAFLSCLPNRCFRGAQFLLFSLRDINL